MADDDQSQGIPTEPDYSEPPKNKLRGAVDAVREALSTPGHVEGPPEGSEDPNQPTGRMRSYANPPGAGGLQAPNDRDSDIIQDMLAGPDSMNAYLQRQHAMPADQAKQITDANGGYKNPEAIYRAGSSLSPDMQFAYNQANAKQADTAIAIARSTSAGEHGPPNFEGSANATNEAAMRTPDGNHVHVQHIGDRMVVHVSPLGEEHNTKTFVVPTKDWANIVPAFHYDSAMQGKLVPALEASQSQRQDLPEGYTRGQATVGPRPDAGQRPAFPAAPGQTAPPTGQQPAAQQQVPPQQNEDQLGQLMPSSREIESAQKGGDQEDIAQKWGQVSRKGGSADINPPNASLTPNEKNEQAWVPIRKNARDYVQAEIDDLQRSLEHNLKIHDQGSYGSQVLTRHDQSKDAGSNEMHNSMLAQDSKGHGHVLPGALKNSWDKAGATSDQRIEQTPTLQHPAESHAVRQDIINQATDAINKRKQMLMQIDSNAKDANGQPLLHLQRDPNTGIYKYQYNQNSPEGQKFHQGLNAPWQTQVGAGSQAAITARTQAHDAQHNQETLMKMIGQSDQNGEPLVIRDGSGNLALNPKVASQQPQESRGFFGNLFGGGGQQSGGRAPSVSTAEEYARIPAGSQYLDARDGKLKVKQGQ